MGRKLTAADMFDTLEVDLFGNSYRLREITRSVGEKLNDAQRTAGELTEDSRPDDIAAAVIGVIDVILAPLAEDTPTVAAVLGEMWEQDKLGLDWLNAFAESLQEEAGARRRPTSAKRTSS